MIYQLMFVIITPALISGAFAEPMKFSAMVPFMVLWSLLIIILKIVDVVIGLRVSPEHEVQGLDLSQHGEGGYYWEIST